MAANKSTPTVSATAVALCFLLDAPYNLTAGHPGRRGVLAPPSRRPDGVRRPARGPDARRELTAGTGAWLAVQERALLPARRKVVRPRKAAAAGVELPRHTGRQHGDAEGDVARLEESVVLTRRLVAKGGWRP